MKFIFEKSGKYKFLIKIISIILGICIWFFLTEKNIIPSFMIPKPTDVFKVFYAKIVNDPFADKGLVTAILHSLFRMVVGILFGILISLLVGIAISLNNYVHAFFSPYIYLLQATPLILIGGLLICAFGVYDLPKIMFIALGVFMQVFPSVVDGIAQTDDDNIRIGKARRLTDFQMIRLIYMPSAAPVIFDAIRPSIAGAWMFLILAEMMAGDIGIGVSFDTARRYHQLPEMFVSIFIIVGLIMLIDCIVNIIGTKLFPWKS